MLFNVVGYNVCLLLQSYFSPRWHTCVFWPKFECVGKLSSDYVAFLSGPTPLRTETGEIAIFRNSKQATLGKLCQNCTTFVSSLFFHTTEFSRNRIFFRFGAEIRIWRRFGVIFLVFGAFLSFEKASKSYLFRIFFGFGAEIRFWRRFGVFFLVFGAFHFPCKFLLKKFQNRAIFCSQQIFEA